MILVFGLFFIVFTISLAFLGIGVFANKILKNAWALMIGWVAPVLRAPILKLAAIAAFFCVVPSVVLALLPMDAVHTLRADWWPKAALRARLHRAHEAMYKALKKRPWLSILESTLGIVASLILFPAIIVWRVLSKPTLARYAMSSTLLPLGVSAAAWFLIPSGVGYGFERSLPEDDSEPNRRIVLVTIASLLLLVAAYEAILRTSPATARWLVGGMVEPRSYQLRLVAAFALALVVAGLATDAEEPLGDVDARTTHLSALFASLAGASVL